MTILWLLFLKCIKIREFKTFKIGCVDFILINGYTDWQMTTLNFLTYKFQPNVLLFKNNFSKLRWFL